MCAYQGLECALETHCIIISFFCIRILKNFGGNLLGARKEFVKDGFTMDVMVVAKLDYHLFQHPENRGI